MIPTSDQLEAFFEKIQSLDRELGKLKGAELRRSETIADIRSVAKVWLRLSEALRSVDSINAADLAELDSALRDMLNSTNGRARASAYRRRLTPVLEAFTDTVVIPVIRFEGTPAQVTARQLLMEFSSKVSQEEQGYLEEAARCLGSKCNRAAIILLWAAGIARFHSAVEKVGFNAYNAAMDQTLQKKGSPFTRVAKVHVTSLPELQRSRDFDILVVGMELWKYDLQAFDELDRLLGIRNSAAHPGMLKPSALDAQQYASKLSTYVFSVVPG